MEIDQPRPHGTGIDQSMNPSVIEWLPVLRVVSDESDISEPHKLPRDLLNGTGLDLSRPKTKMMELFDIHWSMIGPGSASWR